ncbi:MAG: hypothetical protein EBS01_15865, partial [Verrucomicrobia bacterium]|nr:hypothetical protein [Verrucomicrobiota bacterium]
LVSGGAFAQRVALLRTASDLREVALQALGQRQLRYPAARPILLVLNPTLPSATQPQLSITEDPGGIKLQLTLPLPSATATPLVERAILTAVLTELAIRPGAAPSSATQNSIPVIPRWLVDALLHKSRHSNPLQAPVFLRQLLDTGKFPSLPSLLTRPESDPIGSTAQEVDLHRCVLSLLRSWEGSSAGLLKLLSLGISADPFRTLELCFPLHNGTEASLQREWTLHLAASSSQVEMVALDGPQTEAEIQKLLLLDLTDPDTGQHFNYPLSQFDDYLRLPGSKSLLITRQLEWVALRDRAHFLYNEVINTYILACRDLAAGKTKDLVRRLRNATLERESIAARLSRISDALNWFEAVAAPRKWTPQLAEFYRVLDELPPVSERVKAELDREERRLNARR